MRELLSSYSSPSGDQLSNVGIAVLGIGPFCTRQTCNHFETEFDTACIRLPSVEHAEQMKEVLGRLRLIIVDESIAEDLCARPGAYRALNPEATIALGYRDIDGARQFHERLYPGSDCFVGYLPLNAPLEVVLSTVRLLLHKEFFIPACLLRVSTEGDVPREDHDDFGQEMRKAATGELLRLTDREREVLSLASVGQSNKMISRALRISEHTVKLHMHNVYEKLNVSNRTAAAGLYLATKGGHNGNADRPA